MHQMKNIFQQFNSRFLSPAARCLLLVLFIYKTGDAFACNLAITATPPFPAKISTQQKLNTIVYSGKLKWVYSSCLNSNNVTGFFTLLTGQTNVANIKGISGLQVKAQSPTSSGLSNLGFISNRETVNWVVRVDARAPSLLLLGITIEQDIVITASDTTVSGNFPSFESTDSLIADQSQSTGITKGWATAQIFTDAVKITSSPLLPTFFTPTCLLTVPGKVELPTISQTQLTGPLGVKAGATFFDVTLICVSTNQNYTPTLNFSYPTEIVTLPVGAPLCVVKNSIAANSSRNVGFLITNDRNGNVGGGSSTTDACSSNTEVLNPVLTTSPSTTQTKRYQVRYLNTSGGTPMSGFVSSQVVITATFN